MFVICFCGGDHCDTGVYSISYSRSVLAHRITREARRKLFEFSNHAIKSLWADISNKKIVDVSAQNQDNQPEESPAPPPEFTEQDKESAVNLTKR